MFTSMTQSQRTLQNTNDVLQCVPSDHYQHTAPAWRGCHKQNSWLEDQCDVFRCFNYSLLSTGGTLFVIFCWRKPFVINYIKSLPHLLHSKHWDILTEQTSPTETVDSINGPPSWTILTLNSPHLGYVAVRHHVSFLWNKNIWLCEVASNLHLCIYSRNHSTMVAVSLLFPLTLRYPIKKLYNMLCKMQKEHCHKVILLNKVFLQHTDFVYLSFT